MNETWLDKQVLRLWPDIEQYQGAERSERLMEMSSVLVVVPIGLVALVWLVLLTDLSILPQVWLEWLLLFLILLVFQRYSFELWWQTSQSNYVLATGSLKTMVVWSMLFIFGPTVLWLYVLLVVLFFALSWRRQTNQEARWRIVFSSFVHELSFILWLALIAHTIYQWGGGVYPLPSLERLVLTSAIAATGLAVLLASIQLLPQGWRMIQHGRQYPTYMQANAWQTMGFVLLGANLSSVALPFALLGAGLYALFGFGIYLFFLGGVLLVDMLAAQLSQVIKYSRQRSQELTHLEALGRALVGAPPNDLSALPQLLEEHLAGMLLWTPLHIWLTPDSVVYQSQRVATFPRLAEARTLVHGKTAVYYQVSDVPPPPEIGGRVMLAGLVVPVIQANGEVVGGIYALKRPSVGDVMAHLPALQSLAALIASTLERTAVYEQTMAHERMSRELEVAGRIQASFLPKQVPQPPGWDVAAALVPARQTSGDFYDFVELENGRLGIIVADVADKGTGAALYMALSRTLIRTYVMEHPDHPELALQLANERILEDTQSDQFVTVFLGVLTLATGQLVYANAGHNPAYLCNGAGSVAPQALSHTGIPLGMFDAMDWRQNHVQLASNDMLVVYTDGVTEAQNGQQVEFGEDRFVALVLEGVENGRSAQATRQEILTAVHTFVGDAPQFDDMTLLLLQRSSV